MTDNSEEAMTVTEIAQHTDAEHLFSQLDKPSLHALSYILRHPDTWPEGFVWNYNSCNSCAMGLARRLWSHIPQTENKTAPSVMAQTFGIPYETAASIFMGDRRGKTANWLYQERRGFFGLRTREKVNFEDVTPEMVADQINDYLASQK